MSSRLPNSDCIAWLAVLILECLAIVILNIITIIVFVKHRQLRRQSTYLIIHLTIVDFLVGAISGPLQIDTKLYLCDPRNSLFQIWLGPFILDLQYFIYLCLPQSLVNLVFVSLERLHATFRPFKHRFVKKWICGVIITVIWLTTIARESVQIVLREKGISNFYLDSTLYLPFYLIPVFLICACYILIVFKVRCSRHPHHHCAASLKERKLTGTSFIAALVSLFCYLPGIIYLILRSSQKFLKLSLRSYFHIGMSLVSIILMNSIENLVIYAMRMPEFRASVSQIFCRTSSHVIQPDLSVRNLRQARTSSCSTANWNKNYTHLITTGNSDAFFWFRN